MHEQMTIERFSVGIGDRFAHQGRAQLSALQRLAGDGVAVTPVWNKSHREHTIIGSQPGDTRRAADAAVKAAGWTAPYRLDADHIGLKNVDLFIESCDFFTLDVADFIGPKAEAVMTPTELAAAAEAFADRQRALARRIQVPGMAAAIEPARADVVRIARKYLPAVKQAATIYRHIAARKGAGRFITEVSMDETDIPQTPGEMLFILAALAEEHVPAQTIAPRFSGRFNKGVDYVGDPAAFAREFEDDIAVVQFAIREFGLPASLKLSVHSGSDKFSIYPAIHAAIERRQAGLHLKTAGTTWLEEIIGLAESGGEGLAVARDVYAVALGRFEELCAPYAPVIDIRRERLPAPDEVRRWSGPEFASAVRHEPGHARFNPDVRQLLHVGYKVAAEMGARFTRALEAHAAAVGEHVADNLYRRHLRPVFLGR